MSNDFENTPAPAPQPSPVSEKEQARGWERDVLEKLALFTVREQRARRRWSIFFKIAGLAVFIFMLWTIFNYRSGDLEPIGPHVALVEINGTIDATSENSASSVVGALEKGFEAPNSVGVILKINSPGGSPVQSGIIFEDMMRLRKEYPKKPLHVVIEETGASGGYYIAAAGEKIFVNKASLVGSIGVLMDGFDFTGLMEKVGVQRRLLTAGENKGLLDPFSTPTPKQTEYVKELLEEIHQQFINAVREGRGKRLHETPETFSGLIWTGSKAVELGLADDFGNVNSVARDVFETPNIVEYTQIEGLPERVLKKFGVAVGTGAVKPLLSGQVTPLR
jgi:protease-4